MNQRLTGEKPQPDMPTTDQTWRLDFPFLPGAEDGAIYASQDCIYEDPSGFYVWRVDNMKVHGGLPVDRVLNVSKMRIQLADAKVPFLGNWILGPGDVQWMTAGSGIVHEEYHGTEFTQRGGTLEMVQLWVNLRASDKTAAPKYQDLRDDQFPRVRLDGDAGTVRVLAGQFGDQQSPTDTFSPINVWDIELKSNANASLKVPEGHTTVLIVQKGKLTANGSLMQGVELVLFERDGESIELTTDSESRVLLLTGEPLNEPVVGKGPFVMNTREEIHDAIRDYQAGKMGTLS